MHKGRTSVLGGGGIWRLALSVERVEQAIWLSGDPSPTPPPPHPTRKEGITACVRERFGWLAFFFAGLIIAAVVVEAFEDVLKKEVELSYFVPLLIGHGGNTGSQSVATVIRWVCLPLPPFLLPFSRWIGGYQVAEWDKPFAAWDLPDAHPFTGRSR